MKYDAFISYRHLDCDMFVAKKLHRELETTHIPKKIRKETGRKRIRRVFRDQEELPVGSDLGSNIEAALQEAEFLIVICSPQTKESYWVMKEIDTFILMHGRENILAVLVDGEPADSFPPQLLIDEYGNPVEPLAADVRGKHKGQVKKRLKIEGLRIAAALLRVDYDDLKQRHRERQMRRRVGFAAMVACLALAFGALVTYNLAKINEEYQQKLFNESKVLAQTSLEILEDGDRETAVKVALEGLPTKEQDRPFVPESMQALATTLDCYRMDSGYRHEYLLTHDCAISEITISTDGTRALTVDNYGTLYLWDLESGKTIFKKNPEYNDDGPIRVSGIGFIDDLAIVIAGKKITAYKPDGKVAYEKVFQESAEQASFERDDKYIYVRQRVPDGGIISSTDIAVILDGKTGEEYKQFPNQLEEDYGGDAVFSKDGTYCAIAHYAQNRYSEEDADNYVTIINLSNDTMIDVPVRDNTIADLKFTSDGALVVESYNQNAFSNNDSLMCYFEKIDITSGERLWERDIECNKEGILGLNSAIRCREFEQDGNSYKQIATYLNGRIYLLNAETGEDVTTIAQTSQIQQFYLSGSDDRVFVGCEDGKCYFYSGLTGELYPDVSVDFSNDLTDFDFGGKYCIASGFRDSNLVVMRYADKDDSLYAKEMDDGYYYGSSVSPNGKYYVVATLTGDSIGVSLEEEKNKYVVYDTKSGKQKGSFIVQNPDMGEVYFIDNDTVVALSYSGEMAYYSISKNTTESFYPCGEGNRPDAGGNRMSSNRKFMAFNNGHNEYVVVDVKKREVIASGPMESSITSHVSISDDGKLLCYSKSNGSGWIVNTDTGKSKSIMNGIVVKQIAIAPDCKTIGAVCDDGKLRIMNIDDNKILDEIEYFGGESTYVEFSHDGKLVYMQGSDLYYHVYDLEAKEFKFTSGDRTMDIQCSTYDYEKNWIVFFNQNGMIIMDLNSYGVISEVDNGIVYAPGKDVIVGAKKKDLAAYELKSLDKLIKEAHKKYGNEKLTDIQKLKYRIN